jgi:hypothetical protein
MGLFSCLEQDGQTGSVTRLLENGENTSGRNEKLAQLIDSFLFSSYI